MDRSSLTLALTHLMYKCTAFTELADARASAQVQRPHDLELGAGRPAAHRGLRPGQPRERAARGAPELRAPRKERAADTAEKSIPKTLPIIDNTLL